MNIKYKYTKTFSNFTDNFEVSGYVASQCSSEKAADFQETRQTEQSCA